jgi:hypothetical protein
MPLIGGSLRTAGGIAAKGRRKEQRSQHHPGLSPWQPTGTIFGGLWLAKRRSAIRAPVQIVPKIVRGVTPGADRTPQNGGLRRAMVRSKARHKRPAQQAATASEKPPPRAW